MSDDQELLREYTERRSEAAFGQLVQRYVDLVYSSAFRIAGDPEMAKDVSQTVFLLLARKAGSIRLAVALPGWLYRVTCCQTKNAIRAEQRRRRREEEALSMAEVNQPEVPSWQEIAPLLDEAMQTLDKADQDAVIWRFFQQRNLREIGAALSISEDAAQKRLSRALERLRQHFVRRGRHVTVGALAGEMATHAVGAAPVGLAAQLAHASLAHAGASTLLGDLLSTVKFQAAVVALVFMSGVATPVVLQSMTSHPASQPTVAQKSVPQPGPPQPAASAYQGSAAFARLKEYLLRLDNDHPNDSSLPDPDKISFLVWSLPAKDYPLAWGLDKNFKWGELRVQFPLDFLFPFWAKIDPPTALAAAETVGNCWNDDTQWMTEAEKVLAAFETVGNDWNHDWGAALGVLQTWAEQDANAALAYVQQSVPPQYRANALGRVLPPMAKSNLPAALAQLAEIPAGLVHDHALNEIIGAAAQSEPMSAARYAATLPASKKRRDLLLNIAQKWAEKDITAACQWVETLPEDTRARGYQSIISVMARRQPAQAAALLDNLVKIEPALGESCALEIAYKWANSDPAAAMDWTMKFPTELNRKPIIETVLKQWTSQDTRAAADFVASLPDSQEQHDWLKGIVSEWSDQNMSSAMSWVEQLAEGPLYEAAVNGICDGLAKSDPRQAAIMAANLPAGDLQSQAVKAVVSHWARSDINAAADWVASFPEGKTRGEAAQGIIRRWAQPWDGGDAALADQWLSKLSPGPSKDEAARAFVQFALGAPDLAAHWINAFTNEAERNQQIQSIAHHWMTLDPDACREWLKKTTLPEEAKEKLLTP
jgi:RNA polymerase sigma factor (sigma-70 family)